MSKSTAVRLAGYNAVILVGAIGALTTVGVLDEIPRRPWPQMLKIISLLGAAGGTIHALASLAKRDGDGTLQASWGLWYFCRPFLGTGIAIATYLILVSGVGGFKVDSDLVLMGWAILAGLYSQSALDWLRGVFDAVFKQSGGESSRPLPAPAPAPGPNPRSGKK